MALVTALRATVFVGSPCRVLRRGQRRCSRRFSKPAAPAIDATSPWAEDLQSCQKGLHKDRERRSETMSGGGPSPTDQKLQLF